MVWLMDVEAAGEELGAEVEGVRNRLSFLQHNPTPGYVALDQEKAGDGVTSLQGPDNAASTPFDALFLTLYFVQIYVLQLILTLVIVIWTFLDADDLEHDVLLSLDCFAVALLCVEVFAGLMAKGGEFFADLGGAYRRCCRRIFSARPRHIFRGACNGSARRRPGQGCRARVGALLQVPARRHAVCTLPRGSYVHSDCRCRP